MRRAICMMEGESCPATNMVGGVESISRRCRWIRLSRSTSRSISGDFIRAAGESAPKIICFMRFDERTFTLRWDSSVAAALFSRSRASDSSGKVGSIMISPISGHTVSTVLLSAYRVNIVKWRPVVTLVHVPLNSKMPAISAPECFGVPSGSISRSSASVSAESTSAVPIGHTTEMRLTG